MLKIECDANGCEIYDGDRCYCHDCWEKKEAELENMTKQRDELVKAGYAMLETHGMHGPCHHNQCDQCSEAALAMTDALKTVKDGGE